MDALSPSKQELLKALEQKWPEHPVCEKCHELFISPINYRRHVRVHRGSLNLDKEPDKLKLAAFWDKLSFKQVKEILAFDDVILKISSQEIPGSSIIKCLGSSLRGPRQSTLPQYYVKAGSKLLDIIQAKPSKLPISSQELFTILDDASEATFLCAGTAESLEEYVFGGETVTIGLDLKNLVATISFLFEKQLVKAWVAEKDAEALRCQRLLVEEEEAAQKRQATLLERKTRKKLRKKERKMKKQKAETSERSPPSDSSSHTPVLPINLGSSPKSLQPQRKESDEDIEAQFDSNNEPVNQWDSQILECPTSQKLWMQKCAKCSKEFYSPINFKRHIQMHRRSFSIDKVNRSSLAAFWDKLSLQQVKEILAFDDVMLKEIPGSSVITCLASSLSKLGVSTLPQVYVKAGSTLLDITAGLPISSQELFSILDDASERTFLCAGTAESLQKYVFDGETILDLNNLVAGTSFLFEQQLVKAWVADKDSKPSRHQKLKQEEAAQKRQAKRQEKLRVKKQQVKEQFCGDNADSSVSVVAAVAPTLAEAYQSSPPSDSSSNTPVLHPNLDSCLESLQPLRKELNENIEAQFDPIGEPVNQGNSQIIKCPSWPLLTLPKVQMQKCAKCSREFCSPINYRRHVQVHHQSVNVDKEPHENRDSLAAFWDKLSLEQVKEILTFDDVVLKDMIQAISSQELFSILDDASERTFLCGGTTESVFDGETAKSNLDLKNIVATISLLFEQKLVKAWVANKDAEALRCQKLLVEEKEAEQKSSKTPDLPTDLDSALEPLQTQRKESDKDIAAQVDSNREYVNPGDSHTIKPHRPADALKPSSSRGETSSQINEDKCVMIFGSMPVDRGIEDSEQDALLEKDRDQLLPGEGSWQSQPAHDDDFDNRESYGAPSNEYALPDFSILCSNLDAAREVIAKRWEEALAGEHVRLVLPSTEHPGPSDVHHDSLIVSDPSGPHEGGDHANAENQSEI